MNKTDIIDGSRRSGLQDEEDVVNSVFRLMNTAFLRKEDVHIKNFGKFKVYEDYEREGYNFRTKKRMKLPKKLKIKFILSPKIVKMLNERHRIKSN